MTEKEAMEILVNGKEVYGGIENMPIIISPDDILFNIRMNDFELNLDFIQDFAGIDEDENICFFQGHCLREFEKQE